MSDVDDLGGDAAFGVGGDDVEGTVSTDYFGEFGGVLGKFNHVVGHG